jgi:triosephosphate isomerase (TIM)
MRRYLVGGNWKCNGTMDFARNFPKDVLKTMNFDANKVDVVVSPSTVHITTVQSGLEGSNVQVSAQNTSLYNNGAYTGELSAQMCADAKINWVILGHSERRHVFGESDEVVAQKTKLALSHGLSVMACIGEKLDERESNKTDEVNARQLAAIRKEVEDWSNIVVAYEPVWAIGTGKVATPEQAQAAHESVRAWLAKNVSQEAAEKTRILYGGSVTDANAATLIDKPDVDGFLVGGASLKEGFKQIVGACNDHRQ